MWNSGVQPNGYLNVAKGFVGENRKTTSNVHNMFLCMSVANVKLLLDIADLEQRCST
jgi:hypothetical protein